MPRMHPRTEPPLLQPKFPKRRSCFGSARILPRLLPTASSFEKPAFWLFRFLLLRSSIFEPVLFKLLVLQPSHHRAAAQHPNGNTHPNKQRHDYQTMRQLKHHEQKLLRKVDLYHWKNEDNLRVAKVLRTYRIQNRDDYTSYNRLVGMVTKLSAKLQTLPHDDAFRIAMTDQLLTKLHNLGVIRTASSLLQAQELSVSAFCRRRLPVIMVRLKMAQHLIAATTFVETGQVRVGPTVVTDPAFLVSKSMEDYVTWVDQSKVKRTVQKYNDKLDDFDLL